jgi:hypothetical protein
MSFESFQQQVNKAREVTESVRTQLKKDKQKLANVRRKKQELTRNLSVDERESDDRIVEFNNAEKDLIKNVKTGKTDHTNAIGNELEKLIEFIDFTNPIENTSSLNDTLPILLFPLRLETRFKKIKQDDGSELNQLWVRVFPDDISIDSFESDLSSTEIRNIRSYWSARWKAGKKEQGNRAAWRSLAAAHGPGRAYWLTKTYFPDNIDDEPEIADDEIILVIVVDSELAEPQRTHIKNYWQAVWKADKDKAALNAAWDTLVAATGEEEAKSLVEKFIPTNINDAPPDGATRDEINVRIEFLILPNADDIDHKIHAWSQPPSATILPERFVFLAYHGDKLDITPQLGNLVPPKLILGPDPAAEQGEDFRLATQDDADGNPEIEKGDLIFSENMKWMFDFDDAVSKGMGFKIDLTPDQAKRGFDRVFVLGLKLSIDKDHAKKVLQDLFEHHQVSRKGMSILKQGTPTNNTEEDESGYSWRHDPDKSFDLYFAKHSVEEEEEPLDWFSKCDGRWMAELLGINPEALRSLDNYDSKDICEAKAMQRALWPATMGHFMQSMMNPIFSDEVIEQTRQFFCRYVTGRGSIPSIRVGRQPYGILPTTSYTRMRWFLPREPGSNSFTHVPHLPGGNTFLTILYAILMDFDQMQQNLLNQVSFVGKSGDPHQILLDVVGLHPTSVEIYKRYANTIKQVGNIYNATGIQHPELFPYYPTTYISEAGLLAKYGYTINAENPEPKIFSKVFFDNAWILKGPRVDKVPNSEVNELSDYTGAGKNYITWLIEAAQTSHDILRSQEGFEDDRPPVALLYLLLYHALDLSFIDTSLKLHLNNDLLNAAQIKQAYVEPDFIHIEEGKETESRWKYLYKPEQNITGDQTILLAQFIAQSIDDLDEAEAFRNVIAGMRHLERTTTASLERVMLEHIDSVSYRYDAWLSGFVLHQLELMRGMHDSDDGSATNSGIYIGAYGWLEDLRPENKILSPVKLSDELNSIFNPNNDLVQDSTNGGYILAPSQNHAVTAAVLRNGHLSNKSAEDSEQLDIKLTSERVRLALQIIEGIQSGQSLSALLGYQFERGLHDRTDAEVDEFILDLRNAFPLVAKKLKDTTPSDDDGDYESIEQIEARNVIDGAALLEHIDSTGVSTYPFDLDLPTADADQSKAINDEVVRLIDINDAVSDLAMAESVHQVVLGNYERAAAVLDTYSKGNFPPTPDVIRTPRSGTVLTHRIGLQFKTGLNHDIDAADVTPRMHAEPAINHWLASIMPATNEIVCAVKYLDRNTDSSTTAEISMAALGLSHLDLLYLLDIDNEQAMTALDDLIVHHVLSDPVFTLHFRAQIEIEYTGKVNADNFSVFEMASLISSLRAIVLKSRYLTPADIKLPNEASKQLTQIVPLDSNRIQPVIDKVIDQKDNPLQNFIDDLTALIATEDVNNIINALDDLLSAVADIFVQANRLGMTQTGIGFVYRWHQSMLSQLINKLEELQSRWEQKRIEYGVLHDEYNAMLTSGTEEELFAILHKLEMKISTQASNPLPATPDLYFTHINDTLFSQFEILLDTTISNLLTEHRITHLINGSINVANQVGQYDLIGLDIEGELKQVNIFADDVLIGASNLSKEMNDRAAKSQALLDQVEVSADATKNVELVRDAARALFGDDFIMVPEFTVSDEHATEWHNTLDDSSKLLRYLDNELQIDFPVDDWLYGVSRVRDKLYHVENTILHIEGFNDSIMELIPGQFPYRENDYWLALQYPDKIDSGDEPFSIDEDKLLYTAIYTEVFNPAKAQCGLLLDEWTEVIPNNDETAGLTFHYDQPNSEPPQALLLATPSQFTGQWQWQDLVNVLHETLDLAKKRAVEPEHLDTSVYSRFLPPIVSLASPMPVTATLNLALNNQVFFAKVDFDE